MEVPLEPATVKEVVIEAEPKVAPLVMTVEVPEPEEVKVPVTVEEGVKSPPVLSK